MPKPTIEETLEKIKAINIEKDECDRFIVLLEEPQLREGIFLVFLNSTDAATRRFTVSSSFGEQVRLSMLQYYRQRREELIATAGTLIGVTEETIKEEQKELSRKRRSSTKQKVSHKNS